MVTRASRRGGVSSRRAYWLVGPVEVGEVSRRWAGGVRHLVSVADLAATLKVCQKKYKKRNKK
jgi:hypothetical protein